MKQLSYLVGALVAAVSLLPFLLLVPAQLLGRRRNPAALLRCVPGHLPLFGQLLAEPGADLHRGSRQLAVSVPAGFCFAKRNFPGKRVLAFLLVALLVLPVQVTLVPNYSCLKNLGLLNTYAALILPALFCTFRYVPFGTELSVHSQCLLDAARWTVAAPSVFCGG